MHKNCICFAATSNLDFAVANVIIGIEFNSPGVVDNYIIFYDPEDAFPSQDIFTKISKKIIFVPFTEHDVFPDEFSGFNKYSKLYLCKFFIFNLLSEYENVLWLDADLCIQSSIDKIFSYSPIAWRRALSPLHIKLKGFYDNIGEQYTVPNGGVILVNKKIRNFSMCTKHCIEIFYELYNKIGENVNIDELVFGILNLRYMLDVNLLPIAYNTGADWPRSDKSIIIHCNGDKKFWNNKQLYDTFPKWKIYNNYFCQLGGPNRVQL